MITFNAKLECLHQIVERTIDFPRHAKLCGQVLYYLDVNLGGYYLYFYNTTIVCIHLYLLSMTSGYETYIII